MTDIMNELYETEMAVSRKLTDYCIQNDLEFPDTRYVEIYFSGIDSSLILSKISATATPLIEGAINNIH